MDDCLDGSQRLIIQSLRETVILRDEGVRFLIPAEAADIDWEAFHRRSDIDCWDGFADLIKKFQQARFLPPPRKAIVGKTVLKGDATDGHIRKDIPTISAEYQLYLYEFIWAVLNGAVEKDNKWHLAYILIGGGTWVAASWWSSNNEKWHFRHWGLDYNALCVVGSCVYFNDSKKL